MKFLINFLLIFSFLLNFVFASPQSQAAAPPHFQPSKKAWKWADKTLKKMTVDEKIGQLVHVGINATYVNQDSDVFQDLKRQVVENKIGGILLFRGAVYESVHLINRMQELAKIPLLIGSDLEAGAGMRFDDTVNFPWNMAVAATGNPEYARKQGVVTAREAKALGVQQVYAPVMDVNNNADNPVINVRSYGENAEDVARFGAAFIEGLQSGGVLATAKHFPGHGDTNVDSHRGLPIINVSRERLEKVEFVPFRAAFDAGIGSIMVAHISMPQIDPTEIKPLEQAIKPVDAEEGKEIVTEKATVPATLSSIVQTEILRKQMKFDGLIVTDAMSMSGLTLYVNQDEAAVRAFLAGADLLLKPANADDAIRGLKQAVKSGRIGEARLNESVRKLLAWKYELGLAKRPVTPLEEIDKIVANKESKNLAEEIAGKAITLVRNDADLLPLKNAESKRVFVLSVTNGEEGDFAANTFNRFLRESGVKFEAATLDNHSTAEEIRAALNKANKADVIFAGLFARVRTGQARSIGLPDSGVKVLRELINNKKPLIGISFGNPYTLKDFPEMKTYLVAYGDMPNLQRAAARAVLGRQAITGRLPISISEKYPRGTGLQIAAAAAP